MVPMHIIQCRVHHTTQHVSGGDGVVRIYLSANVVPHMFHGSKGTLWPSKRFLDTPLSPLSSSPTQNSGMS